MIDRRRVCAASARKCKEARVRPGQGVPDSGRARSGRVGSDQGESGQVMASRAMVPPTLVILCVKSRVRRLPMP